MRCEQCGQAITGEPVRTPTRVLCRNCGDEFLGMAAGYMADGTVENAVSTAGWFRALRRRKDRDA